MTVHTIDLRFQQTPGIIAAYLLRSGSETALVETGPGSCLAALVEGLASLGVSPSDIGHVRAVPAGGRSKAHKSTCTAKEPPM